MHIKMNILIKQEIQVKFVMEWKHHPNLPDYIR